MKAESLHTFYTALIMYFYAVDDTVLLCHEEMHDDAVESTSDTGEDEASNICALLVKPQRDLFGTNDVRVCDWFQ